MKDPKGRFGPALREAIAAIDLVTSKDKSVQLAAAQALGKIGTSRAANLLEKIVAAAHRVGDSELEQSAASALSAAKRYQLAVRIIEYTFEGLSAGSILVLLALGLSIIFGLMGVINMAQGEFMMVGAFTTLVVSQWFAVHHPEAYNYYLIVAVPAAFLVSAIVGFIVEGVIIRHLYGRPLETLLATWGVGLILIWAVRRIFGDNVTIKPPVWMEGGWEVAPDIVFPLNRVYIINYCAICVALVYFVVNATKLGLLLRATTQNRDMAVTLGVPTRGGWIHFRLWARALPDWQVSRCRSTIKSILTWARIYRRLLHGGRRGWRGQTCRCRLGGIGPWIYREISRAAARHGQEPCFRRIGAWQGLRARRDYCLPAAPAARFVPAQGEDGRCLVATHRVIPRRDAVTPPPRCSLLSLVSTRTYSADSSLNGPARSLRECPTRPSPGYASLTYRRAAAIVIPLLVVAGIVADYKVNTLGQFLCFAIVALGVDLVWGYTGLLSLCQALFFALGGYAIGMFLSLPEGGGQYARPQCMSYAYYGHAR